MRCLVAAFGDPGHVFPAISLARGLAAGGHRVMVETWPQWKDAVEGEDLAFAAADQYQVFPPPPDGRTGGGQAALALMPLIEEFRPDVVINDVLTIAPALAAEKAGVKWATLIPHLYPVQEEGSPLFSIGAMPPRTGLGRLAWRASSRVLRHGLELGRDDLNRQRKIVGLPPTDRFHGGISPDLALIATFPQLEYREPSALNAHITGPMPFEIPHPDVPVPPGDGPLVLVAPSTSQDPDNRLVRSALEAMADLPVRVIATTNRVGRMDSSSVPENATLVDWISYSQVMPLASLVICHGGHGTIARALAEGVPVLACPIAGDMNENATRVAWSGAGLAIRWSLVRPRSVRWAVSRLLTDRSFADRAALFAQWSAKHDGPANGAGLVEELVEGLGGADSNRQPPT
jgi:UDP:flavonoid glycosyltransferase YjiC (YdhE family)